VTALKTLCLKTHLTSATAAAALTALMFVAVAFPPAAPAAKALATAQVAAPGTGSAS
jgi:hypothetical protein